MPSEAQTLTAVIEPVVETMGYEVVHVEWSQSGRHRRLQVYIDHEQGVGLDDCTRLSPIISNALDAAEADPQMAPVAKVLGGAYTLEVSSPGLDRPLSRRSHFERFVGEKATVKTLAPIEPESAQKTFHGIIEGVDADTVRLVASDSGCIHRIPLAQIRRANLVYEG